ncbi:hypothetical protein D8S78_23490 [Natrialba swarupiae]|nr:hypothetical protein [Natrialba swarupiae]
MYTVGVIARSSITDTDVDDWQRHLDVNVTGRSIRSRLPLRSSKSRATVPWSQSRRVTASCEAPISPPTTPANRH